MKTITTSKFKHGLLSTTVLFLIVSTLSCQKNDQFLNEEPSTRNGRLETTTSIESPPLADDYQVQAGTLHFKDGDAFQRVHRALAKMSYAERLRFAQTAGFKSLLTYQNEFVKACEAADATKDEAAYRETLTAYADIFTEDSDRVLNFNVQSPLLAAYQDRAGILYIGQALYRFGDSDQTIVLDGDRAKLNAPESSVVKHISHRQNTEKGARAAATSCKFIGDKVQFGDCGDRHSRLSVTGMTNFYQQGNGQYTAILTPYALAFPFKKNFWGSWVHYDTDNTLYSSWTFTASTTEPNQQYGPPNAPYSYSIDVVHSQYGSQIDRYGPAVAFTNLNTPNGASVNWMFYFPDASGWHDMICVHNPMICTY